MPNDINLDERIKWIEHKGKRILFVDASNFTPDNLIEAINKLENEFLVGLENKLTYCIFDVNGVVFSTKMFRVAKEVLKRYSRTIKNYLITVVGSSGMGKAIVRPLLRNIYFADSIDEAKDWLTKK